MTKRINSKKKGSRGELELSHFLSENGFEARRGQQFMGTPDSPDIICDKLANMGFHIECKRVEAGNPYNWLEQAKRDAGHKIPVVMHRRNNKDWIVVMGLEDMLDLVYYKEQFSNLVGEASGPKIID